MQPLPATRTRTLTIVAQDPAVRTPEGRILCTEAEVPAEALEPGPWGHRVQIIDFDATSNRLFAPLGKAAYGKVSAGALRDPFKGASDATILKNPHFHAQNVYAIVMRTIARFEHALGRRVNWGFAGHQLRLAPHAFADANAFYTPDDRAILFGYFAGANGNTVFTCLSHDVITHETAHALLDGIRTRFTDPSSPDQAAFHEGFADCVALLAVFAQQAVVQRALEFGAREHTGKAHRSGVPSHLIPESALTSAALARSALLGLAEQMGDELNNMRGSALRRSASLKPSRTILQTPEFTEPHRRGEVFVAAMMQTFIKVWTTRLSELRRFGRSLNARQVAEAGCAAADYLLTMAIRALDYTPPVHLEFGDFLSAMLTADYEIRPEDGPYEYRAGLLDRFHAFGIEPASKGKGHWIGAWQPSDPRDFSSVRTHFDAMQHDADEVFRFVWENRGALHYREEAYTRVLSVRPCIRVGPDGFVLHETVAEVIQRLDVLADELKGLRIELPEDMTGSTPITLYGGSTLIFDEYGQLKYEVHNDIRDSARQSARIAYLFESGYYDGASGRARQFAEMHRRRSVSTAVPRSGW
jgi:hypothetical protein